MLSSRPEPRADGARQTNRDWCLEYVPLIYGSLIFLFYHSSDWQPIRFGKQPKICRARFIHMCLKVANSCSSLIAGTEKKEEFDWQCHRKEKWSRWGGWKVITQRKLGGIEGTLPQRRCRRLMSEWSWKSPSSHESRGKGWQETER